MHPKLPAVRPSRAPSADRPRIGEWHLFRSVVLLCHRSFFRSVTQAGTLPPDHRQSAPRLGAYAAQHTGGHTGTTSLARTACGRPGFVMSDIISRGVLHRRLGRQAPIQRRGVAAYASPVSLRLPVRSRCIKSNRSTRLFAAEKRIKAMKRLQSAESGRAALAPRIIRGLLRVGAGRGGLIMGGGQMYIAGICQTYKSRAAARTRRAYRRRWRGWSATCAVETCTPEAPCHPKWRSRRLWASHGRPSARR